MIFTSESGLVEPSRHEDWDAWYRGHLAAMAAVPGVLSAQRYRALDPAVPPSLAMYTVASPAVFDDPVYLRTRGMGPWRSLVDDTLHRRNLFDGLDTAPEVAADQILLVADRAAPLPADGVTWLAAAGLDRSTPYRGIAVLPGAAPARRLAATLGGRVGLYRPMTERYAGTAEPRRNPFGQEIGWPLPGWQPAVPPPRTAMAGRLAIVEPLDGARHAAELFAANALDRDGRNFTYYPYGPFAALADYRAWVDSVCADPHRLFHAIIDRASGKAVGVACYADIQPNNGVIEVAALNFSPLLQRRPAATEAHYLLMRRAFDELGYRRYQWKCDSWNLPSRAAAERLGFTYEGLFRQAIVVKGRNRDTMWYAIVDRDWPRLRHAFECWLDPANFDPDGRQRATLASFR
jgi:RimJ/RimL family protein N-acetyltransferase